MTSYASAPVTLNPPTVFIVDDDFAMRRSTSMLIEAAGLRAVAFESATDFLGAFDPRQPGVILLDLQMPGMSGMDLVDRLNALGALIPIVAVTGTGTIPTAVRAMKLGLSDFLEKPADPVALIAKVKSALEIDAQRRQTAQSAADVRNRFADLTDREFEVLDLLVTGLASKQIANELNISVKTVENHRTHIMEKTKAANVAELVRLRVTDKGGK